jgi:hypothetical protein
MASEYDAALERLEVLIGRWKTAGRTIDASGASPDLIDAIDTYERLPGGALLHLVDARVGDQRSKAPSSSATTLIDTPMRRMPSGPMG